MGAPYIGRFAPSPTGPLHAGSLVAALASWLDARAHQGVWLIRIEDIDEPRCKLEFSEQILAQLAAHGLTSDGPVVVQSQRLALYEATLARLTEADLVYPCSCSRKHILQQLARQGTPPSRHQELVYPGTCRPPAAPVPALGHGSQWAWRFNVTAWEHHKGRTGPLHWTDRVLGEQAQDIGKAVGDFVLKRADGYFAYQLAVVVDDADQGISHVVRGQDLADNTARQIALQQALGFQSPTYCHTPLVLGLNGEKLSKQNGAQGLGLDKATHNLRHAALCLGLRPPSATSPKSFLLSDLLGELVPQWAEQWADTTS